MSDTLAKACDALDAELVQLRAEIDERTDRCDRIETALASLRPLVHDTPPAAAPAAQRPAPAQPAQSTGNTRVCDGCGQTFSALGYGPHRRHCAASGAADAIDYAEVAKVYRDAVAAGRAPIRALMERFGVRETTAKNWPPICRKRGLLDPAKPFTSEPITRAPFDPQKARDEQAGPSVGAVKPLAERPTPAPQHTESHAPTWTPEHATEYLSAVQP